MKIIWCVLLACVCWACGESIKKKEYVSHQETFGELFVAVQTKQIFSNSKIFADAIPRLKPTEILEIYEKEKGLPSFDLKKFVHAHFLISVEPNLTLDQKETFHAYLIGLLESLKRKPTDDGGTLLPTRETNLVCGPGFQESYYKNGYFSILGFGAIHADSLARKVMLNHLQFVQDFGYVPTANRVYYLGRSHPPFLALMVEEVAKHNPEVLLNAVPLLTKEYQYWMGILDKEQQVALNNAQKKRLKAYKKVVFLKGNNQINRFFQQQEKPRDEAFMQDSLLAQRGMKGRVYENIRAADESGWYNSKRWEQNLGNNQFAFKPSDIAPVDLNALMYQLEKTLAKGYALMGQAAYAKSFEALAEKRKHIFDSYFWNTSMGYFSDYNFVLEKSTEKLTLASLYPLFVGLASKEQSKQMALIIEREFLTQRGLSAFSKNEQGILISTELAPADWQWIAIAGLRKYGFHELAAKIKKNWLAANGTFYKRNGHLMPNSAAPRPDLDISVGVLLKLLNE